MNLLNRKIGVVWMLAFLMAGSLGLATSATDFLSKAFQIDAQYREAVRAQEKASSELNQAKADPESAPLTLVRAQEAAELARAKVSQAQKEATARAFDAYAGVATASSDLENAKSKKELADLQLQAAKLRLDAGAISKATFAKSQLQNAQAISLVKAATRNLVQAKAKLKTYGAVTLESIEAPNSLIPDDYGADGLYALAQAKSAVVEAQRALDLASGPDSPAQDKLDRQRDLDGANKSLADLSENVEEALSLAKTRYESAVDSLAQARDALGSATSDLAADQKRFNAGSISKIALMQSRIAVEDADRGVLGAVVELWKARLSLQTIGANPKELQ